MRPRLTFSSTLWAVAAALTMLVGAGCPEDTTPNPITTVQPDPAIGATEFVSAPGGATANRGLSFDAGVDAPTAGGDNGGDRTIEEGDIYRVLADGKILNLNTFRGLQVIDVADPMNPNIIGALRVSGTPVEMYVVGDKAVVLLNQWRSYYGSQLTPDVTSEYGGGVLLVDLSDPTQPLLLDHHTVKGNIDTSRLTQGGGGTAVYVAAALWQESTGGGGSGVAVPVNVGTTDSATTSGEHTIVTSLQVGDATLTEKSTIDLGGWISDIQATTEALLVARTEWTGENTSRVAIIDITDPTGAMVQGAEVEVAGTVQNQFNMDLHGDVLRVVSGGLWNNTETNHIQTFDVTDIQNPTLIDHETFGDGEQLYATLFIGNKAFFVTYFVQDPFHAFAITDEGDATEMSEFIVSGWNDFFRTVFGEDRLIGVGTDDADGKRAVAVSLYDVTDLANATPLLERAEVDMENSWSEAAWDHRAFSVLEGATSVDAGGGVTETGLVLVPFWGWSDEGYESGTQIFTFSDTTITARAVMGHGSPVHRTFSPGSHQAANLSDISLSLYDIADPAGPTAQGTLDLAPSYSGLLTFGDYFARLENAGDYGWWGEQGPAEWDLDIVAGGGDPDTAAAVATIPIKAGASIVKSGDLLVATSTEWSYAEGKDSVETTFDVWNLADPTAPTQVGTLTTDAIEAWSWGYGGYPVAMDCWDCGGWYHAAPTPLVVGDSLVFVEGVGEEAPAGTREVCVTRPETQGGGAVRPDVGEPTEPAPAPSGDAGSSASEPGKADGNDVYYVGDYVCVSVNGGAESCWGQMWQCEGFEENCVEVDPSKVPETTTTCETEPFSRYWTRWVVKGVDLSDPANPALLTPVELPTEHEGVSSVVEGSQLWVSTRTPHTVEGDSRPYFKYWATPIDFAAAPTAGAAVNVPGAILDVDGDSLYTQDFVYNDNAIESALSRLTLADGVATLQARKRFEDRIVAKMVLDGAGHALVAHSEAYDYGYYGYDVAYGGGYGYGYYGDQGTTLTVLGADDMSDKATVELDAWASLRGAIEGRALFQVPDGLLVYNLDDATAPWPQAFFATMGWPQELMVHDRDILFAAGRYGIYQFDIDAANLLAK